MSLTITLDDALVTQLQRQAAARHLSVETLALHILSTGMIHAEDHAWQATMSDGSP